MTPEEASERLRQIIRDFDAPPPWYWRWPGLLLWWAFWAVVMALVWRLR